MPDTFETKSSVDQFLNLLAVDITEYPERLQPADEGFIQRLQLLVAGCEVDLDAALSVADE